MISSADLDSLTVSFPISAATLEEIFLRPESWKLDFKLSYDPSVHCERVEITKDIVAFANTAGGYLVIGVNNARKVVGLTKAAVLAIDESVVRSQVQAFLGTAVDLFVNPVSQSGKRCVVITILRSPRSPLVFEQDGVCKLGSGKTKEVFRKGDVFVRHGSSSERWNQGDVREMYARIVEREKEHWLSGLVPDVRKLIEMAGFVSSSGPTIADPSLLLKSDAESFEKAMRSVVRKKADE